MALTAHQQRNLEALLEQDLNNLREALRRKIDNDLTAAKDQARADWLANNPAVADVVKKVARYRQRVLKKEKEYQAEFAQLGVNVRLTAGFYAGSLDFIADEALADQFNTLHAEAGRRQQRATDIYFKLRDSKQREILLASIGDTDFVLTLPTVDELLQEVG